MKKVAFGLIVFVLLFAVFNACAESDLKATAKGEKDISHSNSVN